MLPRSSMFTDAYRSSNTEDPMLTKGIPHGGGGPGLGPICVPGYVIGVENGAQLRYLRPKKCLKSVENLFAQDTR